MTSNLEKNYVSYSFILSTYSFIFPSYLLYQRIPACDVIRGGGVIANPEIAPLGPELEIFPSPPDIFSNGNFLEFDVIKGGGGGGYSQILKLPKRGIKHETCKNMWKI